MAYKRLGLNNGVVLNADHIAHIEEGIVNSISCGEQTLTETQKAQARENIGVSDAIEEYVSEAILGGAW